MSSVIGFAIISFTFAYLAVQTPDKHGALQILNYLTAYISIFFTGYLAFAAEHTETNPADILTTWVNSFYALIGLVFAYFLIFLLAKVLDNIEIR